MSMMDACKDCYFFRKESDNVSVGFCMFQPPAHHIADNGRVFYFRPQVDEYDFCALFKGGQHGG